MRLSTDEAVSLLKKYSAENVLLQGMFASRSGNIESSVVGYIGYVEHDNQAWVYIKPKGDVITCIGFRVYPRLVFVFGDGRESPENIRETMIEKYDSILTVLDPETDERFYILEIRLSG